MKKFLPVLALVVLFTACNNKKDEKKTDTPPATNTTTTDPGTSTPTTTTNATSPDSGAPKFSDPEVQKIADDYTAFVQMYVDGMKDPSKMAALAKDMQSWAPRLSSVGVKLAKDPAEATKWSQYMLSLAEKMKSAMPAMPQMPK